MVDLVKIRKKAKKGSAGVPPAGPAASSPPEPEPPPIESGSADAPAPASGDAGAPVSSKLEKFKAEAGKRRAAESVKVELAAENQVELLTFVIADEQYAVDIERIVEIVTPRPLTRIPNADRSVVGIVSLRGTIVTLVDVRRKLRHPPAGEPTPDTRIVVIDFHNEIVGFIVDRVLRVVKAGQADIEPHPVVHAMELDESIQGVFRAAGALTILLDLDKLLDHRALAVKTA